MDHSSWSWVLPGTISLQVYITREVTTVPLSFFCSKSDPQDLNLIRQIELGRGFLRLRPFSSGCELNGVDEVSPFL